MKINNSFSKYSKEEVMNSMDKIIKDRPDYTDIDHEPIDFDTDGDNKINEDEFVSIMKSTFKQEYSSEEDYRALFSVLADENELLDPNSFQMSANDNGKFTSFCLFSSITQSLADRISYYEPAVINDSNASNAADIIHECDKAGKSLDIDKLQNLVDSLKPEDLAKVIKEYEQKYGKSFVKLIDRAGMSDKREALNEAVADKLVEAAKKGDVEIVDLLCKELYDGTAGKSGTADQFVKRVINNPNSDTMKVLYMVLCRYSSVNNGHSLNKDIKKDFSGSTEKKLLAILEQAERMF
ncbi:hypothetical protein II906_13330 [bacterium]|nr:hypothetical protein [bacterium]